MRDRDLIDTFDDGEAGADSQEEDLSGQTLGQYKLVRKLADGGMSQVYLADQIHMARWAAVKVLRVASAKLRGRFRSEALAVSRLNHPNIVTVYTFGELSDGSLYLAMEFLDGRNLARVMARDAIPLERALDICLQAAGALAYAHAQGVVHRDLKPHNIMATRSLGRELVKVLDFGLATVHDDSHDTPAGTIVGTPQYMSPEQCAGMSATPLSDQYSLGLIFHELLTGRRVVNAETLVGCIHSHISETPQPPSTIRPEPGVEWFDGIVGRMLAKNPSHRFPSMDAVVAALNEVSGPISHAPSTPTQRAATPNAAIRTPYPRASLRGGPETFWRVHWSGPRLPVASLILEDLGVRGLMVDDQPTTKPSRDTANAWLLIADAASYSSRISAWTEAGGDLAQTLLCVDAAIDDVEAMAAVHRAHHVIIGPHPLDGVVFEAALSGLKHPDGNLIESVFPEVRVELVPSAEHKTRCIDEVLKSLQNLGLRGSVQRSVKAALEEMLLNVVVHAPNAEATPRPALVRWALSDTMIGISVRDHSGSFAAQALVASKVRAQRRDRVPRGSDAGLGLEIIARSAQHVMLAVSPGVFTEVVALIPRLPSAEHAAHKSLALLSFTPRELQLGERLWLSETTDRDGLRISLRGEINESSDLGFVYEKSGRIVLDLSGIEAINSRGVAQWFRAIERRNPELRLLVERCSPAVVRQINMMANLIPRAELLSVMVPFFCDACSTDKSEVLDLTATPLALPMTSPSCERCEEPMELDEMADQYFAFTEL